MALTLGTRPAELSLWYQYSITPFETARMAADAVQAVRMRERSFLELEHAVTIGQRWTVGAQ